MQPIVLDRPFRLWAYGLGHSRLVLRSPAHADDVEQLAVHFYAVRAAELRSFYRPLILGEADQERREYMLAFAEVPLRHQHRMLCLTVSSGPHTGYVLCAVATVVAGPEGQQPGHPGLEQMPGARLIYEIRPDVHRGKIMQRLTRTEMIELIERLMRGEGDDDEAGAWIEALERSIPNPHVSDLIFYPQKAEETLTAEQILDKAFTYRPIEL
jgi:hypothetical protein